MSDRAQAEIKHYGGTVKTGPNGQTYVVDKSGAVSPYLSSLSRQK